MKKKTRHLSATRLRALLSVGLFLLAGIAVGVFILSYGNLRKTAESVSKTTASAAESRATIQSLQSLQAELDKQKGVIARIDDIAAPSQNYQYQNQIVSDLYTYAERAGVSIQNLDFGSAGATTATPPPSGGAQTPATATPTTPQPSSGAGMQTAAVTVTLANPVGYTNLLNFLNMLEQSLPKLKVANINISKSGGEITSEALNIEMYIR